MNLRAFRPMIAPILVLAVCSTACFAASEQQKTERELAHINALSSDNATRILVNDETAKLLSSTPEKVADERKGYSVTYGDLFLMSELIKSGATEQDINAQLKSGKSMLDVANARNADWKKLDNDAKNFEKVLQDRMYESMLVKKTPEKVSAKAPDASAYDTRKDWFAFDMKGYTNDDLAWALTAFSRAKDRADHSNKQNGLSELDYNRMHGFDHIKDGMPASDGAGKAPGITPH